MWKPSISSHKPWLEHKSASDSEEVGVTRLGCDIDLAHSRLPSTHHSIGTSSKKGAGAAVHQGKHALQVNIVTQTSTPNMDSPVVPSGRLPDIDGMHMLTPPSTPQSKIVEHFHANPHVQRPVLSHRRRASSDFCFDIKNIEFDLSDAQLLGSGLWSKVYKLSSSIPLPGSSSSCSAVVQEDITTMAWPPSPPMSIRKDRYRADSGLTPPATPQKQTSFPASSLSLPRALAIKVATRDDALPVFESEAKVLTHLQSCSPAASENYVIPFYGLSIRSRALIFQCADGGSLESLIASTASRSTEENLQLFLHIAPQLIEGLAFLHRCGVVHADIKPANILLSRTTDAAAPRARFADFSASFISEPTAVTAATGGGTWAFMAPEQLSRDAALACPTFESDMYSLGVTLLSLLVGGNPFAAVEDRGLFMLREAVKFGDAHGFATREPAFERRLEVSDEVWKRDSGRVDRGVTSTFLEEALRKNRENRGSVAEWAERVREALQ